MKLNKIAASFALIAGMAMVSCSEGQYWDEASTPNDVYGFAKTAELVTVPAAEDFPSSYTITVRRSSAGPELTVPVTHKADNDLLSGAPTVTFPAGSQTAEYKIDIAPGGEAGIYYSDIITLEAPEDVTIEEDPGDLQFTFQLYHELNWVNAGMAAMSASGVFDTEGETVDVQIQVATNWPKTREKMCRLVSPFHVLDPEGVPAGHDIWFILNRRNAAYKMYEPLQFSGLIDDEVGYLFFGTISTFGGKFSSRDEVFTMTGVLQPSTTEKVGDVDSNSAYTQNLVFTWPDYDKALDEYGK